MNRHLSKVFVEKQPFQIWNSNANAHPVSPGCERAVPDNTFNGLLPGPDVERVGAIRLRRKVKTANAFDCKEQKVNGPSCDGARRSKRDPKSKIISRFDCRHGTICKIQYLDSSNRKIGPEIGTIEHNMGLGGLLPLPGGNAINIKVNGRVHPTILRDLPMVKNHTPGAEIEDRASVVADKQNSASLSCHTVHSPDTFLRTLCLRRQEPRRQ